MDSSEEWNVVLNQEVCWVDLNFLIYEEFYFKSFLVSHDKEKKPKNIEIFFYLLTAIQYMWV